MNVIWCKFNLCHGKENELKLTKICTSETEAHSPQLNLQKTQNNLCIMDFNPYITLLLYLNFHEWTFIKPIIGKQREGEGVSCGKENGGGGGDSGHYWQTKGGWRG